MHIFKGFDGQLQIQYLEWNENQAKWDLLNKKISSRLWASVSQMCEALRYYTWALDQKRDRMPFILTASIS